MTEQTFQTQMEDIHTFISEIGLTELKLSNRITRLEKRMLVIQQAVRLLQLEKDGEHTTTHKG